MVRAEPPRPTDRRLAPRTGSAAGKRADEVAGGPKIERSLDPSGARKLCGAPQLYLIYAKPLPSDRSLAVTGEAMKLAAEIFLVRSPLTRSRLYHQVKKQLPRHASLLVAPLADAPKFKALNRGALAWLRERRDESG